MKKKAIWLAALFLSVFGIVSSFGQKVPEEAKRHFDLGLAAVEAAKSPADYETAIREFEQAARLAPGWPEAFYCLGLVQEKAKIFPDAVKNFQQYLRLAPDAKNADEVRALIKKLENTDEPGLPIAQGYEGIPWGTGREQIIRALNQRGWRYVERDSVPYCLKFRAVSAGAPLEKQLFMENGYFVGINIVALIRTPDPQAAYSAFLDKKEELSREYGLPSSQSGGGLDPIWAYTWNIIDKRNSDKYYIHIEYASSHFSDNINELQYYVDYFAIAESLAERLKNGERGINAEKNEEVKPTVISKEEVKPKVISKEQEFNNKGLFDALFSSDSRKEDVDRWITAGADVNAQWIGEGMSAENPGSTPLQIVAQFNFLQGKRDLAERLIAGGADVNAKNVAGETPLLIAIENGQDASLARLVDMVELLIAGGADVNAKNDFGWTPLGVAESRGFKEIADLLRKHGAKR